MNEKKLQIRNSTVDFLMFTRDAKEEGIEVRVQDNDVWLTQKAIGELFDIDRTVVTKMIQKLLEQKYISINYRTKSANNNFMYNSYVLNY